MALPPSRSLTRLSDDALRVRLWRAAETRIGATTQSTRDRAGLACREIIAELRRRRVPVTRSSTGTAFRIRTVHGGVVDSGSSRRVTTTCT